MAIEENDKVARAERLLEEALADPETREILRIKEKIRFDKRMDIEGAEMRGEKRGKKESQRKIAHKLKERGMSTEEISEITGLNKKEIEQIK